MLYIETNYKQHTMKKLIILFFLVSNMFFLKAQEIVVALHYVKVETSHENKLIELEQTYFKQLHKYAIENSGKIGWDMWKLENDEDENYSTFVYAHLWPSLDVFANNNGWNGQDLFSESEMSRVWEQLSSLNLDGSKTLMTLYKGGFAPVNEKPAEVLQLSFMNVDPTMFYEYEQTELNDFQPNHKNNELVVGWGLHKILNARGEKEEDYVTANFFENMVDVYKNNSMVGPSTKAQKSNYQSILKLREMTRVEMLTLVDGVR
jgi:hypothetical protein